MVLAEEWEQATKAHANPNDRLIEQTAKQSDRR